LKRNYILLIYKQLKCYRNTNDMIQISLRGVSEKYQSISMSIGGVFLTESTKIPWKKYRGHIGGASRVYQRKSGHIKVIRILRYVGWNIGCVSHTNCTCTHVGYVSDTRYVSKLSNPGNPGENRLLCNIRSLKQYRVIKDNQSFWSGISCQKL
jgi:hypothetical protein